MQINIKIILDAVNILKMKQEGKNLIIKRIEIIHKLFDNFQLYHIRRESQNFFGFRKQFANFSITPFILENEYLNRYKMKLNENLQDKINEIKILYIPIKEIRKKEKEKEKKNINNDIDNKNSINIINLNNLINLEETGEEKLKKYIINQENDIKYNENKKLNLLKLKLVYKSKFVPRKKNGFKNEINLNINLNISRDTLNNNELSMINNNENLESNINNTFYDLFTVESLAKSNMQNSTFMRDEV